MPPDALYPSGETTRLVQTVQRVGTDLPQTVLEFDETSRLLTLGGTKAEVHSAQIERKIEEFLKSGAEKSESKIMDGVDGRLTTKLSALRALVDEGTVNRSGTGKRGDAYLYSLSRSLHMAGTRERESEIGVQTTANREEKLVPDFQRSPKLVPENQVDEVDGFNVDLANLQLGQTADGIKGGDEVIWL